MGGWKDRLFLVLLVTPLVAKLSSDAGWALAFIYPSASLTIRTTSLTISLLLALLTISLMLRCVLVHAWTQAVLLVLVSALAIVLPRLDFDVEYFVFKQNEASYMAAIEAESAAPPRFKYFDLREFSGLAGGDFYYVVYDEAQEIDLPPEKQSAGWKSLHYGFTSAGVKGIANPQARITASRLEGSFFLVMTSY